MSSHPHPRTHPVRAFARQLTTRLDQLAPTAVWSMTPADQRDTLLELAKAEVPAGRSEAQGPRRG